MTYTTSTRQPAWSTAPGAAAGGRDRGEPRPAVRRAASWPSPRTARRRCRDSSAAPGAQAVSVDRARCRRRQPWRWSSRPTWPPRCAPAARRRRAGQRPDPPLTDAVAELEPAASAARWRLGIRRRRHRRRRRLRRRCSRHRADRWRAARWPCWSSTSSLPAVAPPTRSRRRRSAEFTAFVEEPTSPTARSLDLLHDVEMGVTAELGRTRMTVRDLLSLTPGAVVELDRAAGSPVDVLVNGTLIARGEVVVIDEEFGIRISEIIGLQARDCRVDGGRLRHQPARPAARSPWPSCSRSCSPWRRCCGTAPSPAPGACACAATS